MRTEQEVFDELAKLCASPGYVHAIAYLNFRDNVVGYADQLKADDYAKLYGNDRLIRTEISTLIGLMLRRPRDLGLPSQEQLGDYIQRTEALLRELHDAMNAPMHAALRSAFQEPEKFKEADPLSSAEAMREPIFYGAESAYSFQYRDLSERKYARDTEWLKANKGFPAAEARKVVSALNGFLSDNLLTAVRRLKELPPEQWTLLPAFEFSCARLASASGLSLDTIKTVVEAFCFPDTGNPTFTELSEFNAANAYPIIRRGDDEYILFQYVSLTEALYDTPFYWMGADRSYQATAMRHRGLFTEEFTAERLERVFGAANVHRNVDLWKTKGKKEKLGEIDVLVIFADRAIVVQAKSKKLTLLARKGNDLQLKSDFKAAVQDAYEQGQSCSEVLLAGSAHLADVMAKEITLPLIREAHPLCLVADHYPALSFQAGQFLQTKSVNGVTFPLVCDVFLIDVLSEFLDTPLRFLSYLELRAKAKDKLLISHEITALGYHLKQNLWLGEYDTIHLDDDIATDVNIAMAARRDGIDGETTPPGILTLLRATTVGRIVAEIERKSDPAAVGIGLELLKLSSESANHLSEAIDMIVRLASEDGKPHDATVASSGSGTGITVHCNFLPGRAVAAKLKRHCELRKYSQKAPKWFGLLLEPLTGAIRSGLVLDFPWQQDEEWDEATAGMKPPEPIKLSVSLLALTAGSAKSRAEMNHAIVAAVGSIRSAIFPLTRDGRVDLRSAFRHDFSAFGATRSSPADPTSNCLVRHTQRAVNEAQKLVRPRA